MLGMLYAISFLEGLYVLKKAQAMLTVKMNRNSRLGNTNGVGMLIIIERWNEIDHPTIVPIIMPLKEEATTKTKASYMYSFVMIF